jgi:hypothetical protein
MRMRIRSLRWHTGWHTPGALALLPALGAFAYAAPTSARCTQPEPSIVWSHPAQGATDVPTNTDLWIMPTGWGGPPRVSRQGSELPRAELPFGYDLGELPPNSEITLQVEVDGEPLELAFTTASGPSAADPGAAPGAVTATSSPNYALSELCQAALNSQDCFDTGQNTYHEFTPTGHAVGWLVASNTALHSVNLWPGECGAPRLFDYDYNSPCVVLSGIDASGATHAGERVCVTSQGESDDAERTVPAWGCALPRAQGAGWGAGWALSLLGVLGRWRTARSRRHSPR